MKNEVLDKTIQIMEKELQAVKRLNGEIAGAKSLRGILKGVSITEADIEGAKQKFNKVNLP